LFNLHYHSAGIGRSGTFMAIDTEIQRIEKRNVIDVYKCVQKMRFWRNFMVQTVVSCHNNKHMSNMLMIIVQLAIVFNRYTLLYKNTVYDGKGVSNFFVFGKPVLARPRYE